MIWVQRQQARGRGERTTHKGGDRSSESDGLNACLSVSMTSGGAGRREKQVITVVSTLAAGNGVSAQLWLLRSMVGGHCCFRACSKPMSFGAGDMG